MRPDPACLLLGLVTVACLLAVLLALENRALAAVLCFGAMAASAGQVLASTRHRGERPDQRPPTVGSAS
jgi:hypothetical protein